MENIIYPLFLIGTFFSKINNIVNLFDLGIFLVVATFLYGLTIAKLYNIENQEYQAKIQRILCISYGIVFFVLSFGASTSFISNAWGIRVIIIGASMMGFGVLLEARSRFPNAPRGYGEE